MIDTPKTRYLNGDGAYLRAGPATVGDQPFLEHASDPFGR
jgi:hypothetical protein